MSALESDIAGWRSFVVGRAVDGQEVDELEDHLRAEITELTAVGLTDEEAFLVAVKRMGSLDELSREFAREHSGRMWTQHVSISTEGRSKSEVGAREAVVVAITAAVTTQLALLVFGYPDELPSWAIRNSSFLVLSFLAAYLARRKQLASRLVATTAVLFTGAVLVANVYPFEVLGSTEILVTIHLPLVLWFIIGLPYTSGEWRSHERRMDFVRFTGEWFIYYVLIALGGVVLIGLTALVLGPTGVESETVAEWVLPSGVVGAVIVAAWLVETRQRAMENMAPVLTMIFTPLFAVMLVTAVGAYLVSGLGDVFDRELLGTFDALLVVVLGLVLYGISARDPESPAGWNDRIQLTTVVAALLLDVLVLTSMVTRVAELGFTANRAAAMGLNLVLLVNLGGTAWLLGRFVAGRGTFHRLERWQTSYFLVFPIWAAVVVAVFPPVFGFA